MKMMAYKLINHIELIMVVGFSTNKEQIVKANRFREVDLNKFFNFGLWELI